ncbi:hypothetical protein [Bacillus sp. FJAT-29814]|uniref:hypothetical protein n=1 Tax=Bacillus sp. FJAT-29814 TaxID=1729688 RepID=UPI00083099E4|nr:hypothetical protein [Bacillus sp. FJAT-29814]
MRQGALILLLFLFTLSEQGLYVAAKNSSNIEMMEWKEVDQLLPRYSKYVVLDLETGKKFKVQRRAGSRHADVQPLTAKDTKIMKSIYGGKWSWKRRAIIVIYKDRRIAASMHGMPHGAGALKNNFPGHFCIHYYGSTTHRTQSMDLSHKLMILKASGNLDDYLGNANPYEVIEAYIAGFKQQDTTIASMASLQQVKWQPIMKKIDNVAITRMELLPPEDLTEEISLDVPIQVDWLIKNKGGQRFNGYIHLVRFSPLDAWKVDSINFIKENNL